MVLRALAVLACPLPHDHHTVNTFALRNSIHMQSCGETRSHATSAMLAASKQTRVNPLAASEELQSTPPVCQKDDASSPVICISGSMGPFHFPLSFSGYLLERVLMGGNGGCLSKNVRRRLTVGLVVVAIFQHCHIFGIHTTTDSHSNSKAALSAPWRSASPFAFF